MEVGIASLIIVGDTKKLPGKFSAAEKMTSLIGAIELCPTVRYDALGQGLGRTAEVIVIGRQTNILRRKG